MDIKVIPVWLDSLNRVQQSELHYTLLENKESLKDLIEELALPDTVEIFLALGAVCYALSLNDSDKQNSIKLEAYKFNAEGAKRMTTLLGLDQDKELQASLNIDPDKLSKVIDDTEKIAGSKDGKRYSDKSLVNDRVSQLFIEMHQTDISKADQIDNVFKVFKKYEYEDYAVDSNTPSKHDRIRKIQENAIKVASGK